MRVLYVANTAAEYRIPFFNMLHDTVNTKFIFTKMDLNRKIYNNDTSKVKLSKLHYHILSNNFLKHYLELIKILIKAEYDVAVVPPLDSVSEALDAYLVAIISKLRLKRTVYFWEKWEPEKELQSTKKRIKNGLQKITFMTIKLFIDGFIAPGNKTKDFFVNSLKVAEQKIYIAPDASEVNESFQVENIRYRHSIGNNTKVILYLGRIVKRKGLDILIKAFYNLEKKYNIHNSYLLVCGEGDFEVECRKLVKDLKLTNVEFCGKTDTESRNSYFLASDIFVLPSIIDNGTIEAWGLTVNEAMQFGLPVIATTAVGSSYDLIKDGINGYMVKSGDSDDLAEKLYILLKNEDKIGEISNNAKSTIYNNYRYSDMVKGFMNAFTKEVNP